MLRLVAFLRLLGRRWGLIGDVSGGAGGGDGLLVSSVSMIGSGRIACVVPD